MLTPTPPQLRTHPPTQVFYLATQGGAEVLGLGEQVGNFEPGKYFDALIVDPNTDDSPLDIFDGEVSGGRGLGGLGCWGDCMVCSETMVMDMDALAWTLVAPFLR